jgi:cAMP-specific phosphodiesterase
MPACPHFLSACPHAHITHTQTTVALAAKSGILASLCSMERFTLAIAAVCHDLEHPGVNNQQLISFACREEPQRAFLEKHHSRVAFQLMVLEEVDLLKGFSTTKYYAFRDAVFKLILATDMSRHSDYMTRMRSEENAADDRQYAMELLLKCGDISNVVKPFGTAKKWAVRVSREFFAQGDLEKERGLKITPVCDRSCNTIVQLQKSFIDFIARPFFTAVEEEFPSLQGAFDHLHVNRGLWDSYTDEQLLSEVGEGW